MLTKAKRLLRSNKQSAITSDKLKPIPFVIRCPNFVPSLNAVSNRFSSQININIEGINNSDKMNLDNNYINEFKINMQSQTNMPTTNDVELNLENESQMNIEVDSLLQIVKSNDNLKSKCDETRANIDDENLIISKVEDSEQLCATDKCALETDGVEHDNNFVEKNVIITETSIMKGQEETSITKDQVETTIMNDQVGTSTSEPPTNQLVAGVEVVPEVATIPEPTKFSLETATKYYKDILLCQYYSNILKKALQALEQEIMSISVFVIFYFNLKLD